MTEAPKDEGRAPLTCVLCSHPGTLAATNSPTARCAEHAKMAPADAMAVADPEDRADLLAHLSCVAFDDEADDEAP